ncbi:MAG TPA: ABC transporter ATP-binding protein [Ruminococcaceae bacterium]|nr:ABC transporter ATP-binding protein [Oscillospiraceae bacterium]
MSNIIEVSELRKFYGKNEVLKGLSLSYQPGQIIGLLGPNGCGKTTLMKILVGLIHDYEGSVKIDGQAPGIYTKSVTAYLPERTYLPEWMRAGEAIDYFQDFFPDFDKQKSLELLRHFGLDEKQKIKSMSKGMQEKLQLLIVMSRNAKLYCLDEPLGGVDPATRSAILDFIMQNYTEKSTVLITTHLINDVERIFNSVLMIGNGHIAVNSSVDAIRESGKSVEELFKEVFSFAW